MTQPIEIKMEVKYSMQDQCVVHIINNLKQDATFMWCMVWGISPKDKHPVTLDKLDEE